MRVTIVEPGRFATGCAGTAHVVAPDEVYPPAVGEFLTGFAALPPSAFGDTADPIDAIAGMAEPPRVAVGPTRSTAPGRTRIPAGEPEKSAQCGRLAQQH